MQTYRVRTDYDHRKAWAQPLGVAEGSDFELQAVLLRNGVVDATTFSSGVTIALTVSDSVLNGGTALLNAEGSDSFTAASGLVKWSITDTQSNDWQAGTYNGDIKVTDTSSLIHYFPISLKVREVKA